MSVEVDKQGRPYSEAKDYLFPKDVALEVLNDMKKDLDNVKAGVVTEDDIKDMVYAAGGLNRELIDLVKSAGEGIINSVGRDNFDNKDLANNYLEVKNRLHNMSSSIAEGVWRSIAHVRNGLVPPPVPLLTWEDVRDEDIAHERDWGYKIMQIGVDIARDRGIIDIDVPMGKLLEFDISTATPEVAHEVKNALYELDNLRDSAINPWSPARNEEEIDRLRPYVGRLIAMGPDGVAAAEAIRKRIRNLSGENYGSLEKMVPGEQECGHCGMVMSATSVKCLRCEAPNDIHLSDYEFMDVVRFGGGGFGDRRLEEMGDLDPRMARQAEIFNNLLRAYNSDPKTLLEELKRHAVSMSVYYGNGALGLDMQETVESVMMALRGIVTEAKAVATATGLENLRTEQELILFWRPIIVEALSRGGVVLTEKGVTDYMAAKVGYDKDTYKQAEIVPSGFTGNRIEMEKQLMLEIRARINLKQVLNKELEYKRFNDKGAALKTYITDNKGSETGKATAETIADETYDWLTDLVDAGDGLSVSKTDEAFGALLALGEGMDTRKIWHRDPAKATQGKTEDILVANPVGFVGKPWEELMVIAVDSNGRGYYDENFSSTQKKLVDEKLDELFGADAVLLAKQVWAGFKEEAKYNNAHYLNGLVRYGASRHFAATVLASFTGSSRIYEEGVGTFESPNEIQVVANTALDAQNKVFDHARGYPEKRKGALRERAIEGRLLRGLPGNSARLSDRSEIEKTPQVASFGTIKNGDTYVEKVKAIGALGAKGDKAGKDKEAEKILGELRDAAESLVDGGIITSDELNRQMLTEAKNAIWELSIDKDSNIADVNTQEKMKPGFLLPSKLATLLQAVGGTSTKGRYILGSDEDFHKLRTYVEWLRKQTWNIYQRMEGDDEKGQETESKSMNNIELPERRGQALIAKGNIVNQVVGKPITGSAYVAGRVLRPLGKLIGKIPGFEEDK